MPLIDINDRQANSSSRLLALDDALIRLSQLDSHKAELVKLRYFCGLTIEEAAQTLGVSSATANRYWNYARAWLQVELSAGVSSDDDALQSCEK